MNGTLTSGIRGSIDASMRPYLPKFVRILDELRQRALNTPEGQSFGTVASWKAEFSVSQSTIDRALQELRREGLISSHRGKGSHATRPTSVRHLGVFLGLDIFDTRRGEFPLLMLKALRHAVSHRECILRYYLPASSGDLMEDRMSSLRGDVQNRLVDGLIFWATHPFTDENLPIPAVSLMTRPGIRYAVRLDDVGLVRMAANELLRLGCRRIALLKGGWLSLAQILPVFCQELDAGGACSAPEWQRVLHGPSAQDTAVTGGQEFKALWNALPEKPDGLISGDDYATSGVLDAMQTMHLRPGRDLHIASHANRGSSRLGGATITRIEFDPDEIAEALLDLVHRAIDGQVQEKVVTVPPHVVAVQPTIGPASSGGRTHGANNIS